MADEHKPKNVLWIMTDQHQASCLGCMGNPVIQTPNLDRLASEGTLFENAFCQTPACMASRASLFTGRYPQAVRVRGMGMLPPLETTFPEWLQRQGYNTGAFGKLHLTPQLYTRKVLDSDVPVLDWKRYAEDACLPDIPDDPYKENYGFQTLMGCGDACRGNHLAWLKSVAPELAEKKPEPIEGAPGDMFVSPYPSEYHITTFIANEAEEYIRSRAEAETPWMTFCSFIAPHHPFEAPEDQLARYEDKDISLPNTETGVDIQSPPPEIERAIGEMDKYSEEIQRQMIKHYYASISLIDDCVGRLITALEETGQREDTLILFVSDHGEHLGNHGLLRKSSFHYDEILRVPMICNSPGQIDAGREVNGLVELTDVYPTLLGLLGLPINAGVQGRDWSSDLVDGTPLGRQDIYSEMFDMDPMTHAEAKGPYRACQTIRTESWKLNVYPTHLMEASQLFDLENDPAESRNRFHDPACREVRDQMLWRLLTRLHADTDPLPLRLTQW